jgi:hypothetical protein
MNGLLPHSGNGFCIRPGKHCDHPRLSLHGFFLAWEINATMMYILLLAMVLSAVLLLIPDRTAKK